MPNRRLLFCLMIMAACHDKAGDSGKSLQPAVDDAALSDCDWTMATLQGQVFEEKNEGDAHFPYARVTVVTRYGNPVFTIADEKGRYSKELETGP